MDVGSDGTINNDKLNQAITELKAEEEAGHERNINTMTQVDEYKSPRKNKDASMIKNLKYYKSDEHEFEISYSSKQVEASRINLTLRINGRSWPHQYQKDTICHHQNEKDTMIHLQKALSIRPLEVTEL